MNTVLVVEGQRWYSSSLAAFFTQHEIAVRLLTRFEEVLPTLEEQSEITCVVLCSEQRTAGGPDLGAKQLQLMSKLRSRNWCGQTVLVVQPELAAWEWVFREHGATLVLREPVAPEELGRSCLKLATAAST